MKTHKTKGREGAIPFLLSNLCLFLGDFRHFRQENDKSPRKTKLLFKNAVFQHYVIFMIVYNVIYNDSVRNLHA